MESRTWTIDTAFVDRVSNDVQTVVDCSNEGDTVLFNVTTTVTLPRRVTIPWNLTLSAMTSTLDVENGTSFPRTADRTILECPRGSGSFLLRCVLPSLLAKFKRPCRTHIHDRLLRRTPDVLLANLVFEGCDLDEDAIVEVDACRASEDVHGVIKLHHVAFRGNVLNGSSAFSSRRSDCLTVEMIDVEFSNASCGDGCFAQLAGVSRLRDVSIRDNVPIDSLSSARQISSLLGALASSVTTVIGLQYSGNEVSAFRVNNGALNLSHSSFEENSVGPLVRLGNGSRADIVDCVFRDNRAEREEREVASREACLSDEDGLLPCVPTRVTRGIAIASRNSVLQVQRSEFRANAIKGGAGVLFSFGGSLEIDDSLFENNTVTQSGGAAYLYNCSATIRRLQCMGNQAEERGGCIYAERSRVRVARSTIANNTARDGGGMCGTQSSELNLTRTEVVGNSATEGGGMFMTDMTFRTLDCVFRDNVGDTGGGIRAVRGEAICRRTRFLNNRASTNGGAVHLSNATGNFEDCTASENEAENRGGAVSVVRSARFFAADTVFFGNRANRSGGALRILDATGEITRCQIKQSVAERKGAVDVYRSTFVVRSSTLTENTATVFEGGGIDCRHETLLEISDSVLTRNVANLYAGALHIENSEARISNVSFTENRAETHSGGGVYSAKSSLEITSSEFVKNRADLGGAIRMAESTAVINDTQFISCEAVVDGGAFFMLNRVEVSLFRTLMEHNVAGEYGGAIYSESVINGSDVTFRNNSAAVGGGVNCRQGCRLVAEEWNIHGNAAATRGGGIYLQVQASATITNSSFAENSARDEGGSFYVEQSTLVLKGVRLETGTSRDGGSLFAMEASDVTLRDTTLDRNVATGKGGSIVVRDGNFTAIRVNISDSTASETGGAVELKRARMMASRLRIANCTAAGDGGGIRAENRSSILCTACVFVDNRAGGSGGAVYVKAVEGRGVAYQFAATRIERNRADLGGNR